MEEPTPDEIAAWHRWFAVECNNHAWDLAAKYQRTAPEEREMLGAAYAAAFHWGTVGQAINDARADMLLAHVHSAQGNPAPALEHAERSLAYFSDNPCEAWDLAFAHAEMAHAAAAAGDKALHREHYDRAKQLGEAIEEEEERRIFLEEFERIPTGVR